MSISLPQQTSLLLWNDPINHVNDMQLIRYLIMPTLFYLLRQVRKNQVPYKAEVDMSKDLDYVACETVTFHTKTYTNSSVLDK